MVEQRRARRTEIDIESTLLCGICILIVSLLFLRDAMGMYVNKWIFLIILAPALLFMRERNMMALWAFIMPLYVGLPGNYLTLIITVRFALNYIARGLKLAEPNLFIWVLITAIYILAQNMFYGITNIFRNIFVVELIIAYIVFCSDTKSYFKSMYTAYATGIAVVGVIMLAYTLRIYGIQELFSAANRLGSTARSDTMTVIIDSNYYGTYVIASVSIGWLLLQKNKTTFFQKIWIIVAVVVALLVACIGLSRSFILVLALWAMMVILSTRKLSHKILFIGICVCVSILVINLIPGAVDAIVDRFQSDDMEGGNGRTEKLLLYANEWLSSAGKLMFGVGFAECLAHCMQAQYFFGLGIIGSCMFAAMGCCYWNRAKQIRRGRSSFDYVIPAISVQIMAATVPIAQSLTFMLPVFMTVLAYKEISE